MRPLSLLSATALTMAVLTAPMVLVPSAPAHAQFGVSITVAPPELPVYVQPPLPAPGYVFTPGFWNYGAAGYYWVPGTWVEPPSVGLLWTPGYWGFNNGIYAFNRGYWGPHVGFYGGINYGFGYGGIGFQGGEWRGGVFAYNRAVNNFGSVHVTNVYDRTVVNTAVNRVSFNGPNGVNVHPRPEELAYAHEAHVQPTAMQQRHDEMAARSPDLRASVNHGTPALAATARPAAFHPAAAPVRAAGTPAPRPAPHPALRSPGMTHPTGMSHPMASPRPMGRPAMAGPRPMAAPHPAQAAHPGAGGHEPPRPR